MCQDWRHVCLAVSAAVACAHVCPVYVFHPSIACLLLVGNEITIASNRSDQYVTDVSISPLNEQSIACHAVDKEKGSWFGFTRLSGTFKSHNEVAPFMSGTK